MSIHITDIVAAVGTVAAAVLLEPVYTDLLGDFTGSTGALSGVLAQMFVPLIFVGIIISIGVSARRGQ